MSRAETRDARSVIREFLADGFMLGDDTIADSASLLESGVVDSTGIMQLVAFLETEFGVRVEDDELTADNLDSVDRIVGFVEAKRAVASEAAGS